MKACRRHETTRDPLDPERAFKIRRSLQSIENVANWLADVQGRRKALLFFSEGFDYDIYQPFDSLPRAAPSSRMCARRRLPRSARTSTSTASIRGA